jgi:hypothetical protein
MTDHALHVRDGKIYPEIAGKLIIPVGKNKGRHPSIASVYRILAEDAAG